MEIIREAQIREKLAETRAIESPKTSKRGWGILQIYKQEPITYVDLNFRNICGRWWEKVTDKYINTHTFDYEFQEFKHMPYNGPALHWFPRSSDISRMVKVAKHVFPGNLPFVVDLGCGTGLLPCLLARTNNVLVAGTDPDREAVRKTSKGESYYTHPNLELLTLTARNFSGIMAGSEIDVAITSWVPQYVDFSESVLKLNPKAIVSIDFIDDLNYPNSDTAKALVRYEQSGEYQKYFTWSGASHHELLGFSLYLHSFEPKTNDFLLGHFRKHIEKSKIEGETRFSVFLKRGVMIPPLEIFEYVQLTKFPWEEVTLESLMSVEGYRNLLSTPDELELAQNGLDKVISPGEIQIHL